MSITINDNPLEPNYSALLSKVLVFLDDTNTYRVGVLSKSSDYLIVPSLNRAIPCQKNPITRNWEMDLHNKIIPCFGSAGKGIVKTTNKKAYYESSNGNLNLLGYDLHRFKLSSPSSTIISNDVSAQYIEFPITFTSINGEKLKIPVCTATNNSLKDQMGLIRGVSLNSLIDAEKAIDSVAKQIIFPTSKKTNIDIPMEKDEDSREM